MFIKIPFESEIEFKTNIYDITKMSLEHDFNTNEGAILGNFYVSGEYKTHEVSVNTEPFNYTLPFTVELRDDIEKDTLEFNIEDFTYEIVDNKKLKINIEYSLKAEERKDNLVFERVDEEELDSELAYIDSFLEEKEDMKQDEIEDKIKERISDEEEKTIMDTIKSSDDTFVTYHIHIVKESETIESICKEYNVSNNLIGEYNDLNNFSIGDKIVIPKIDE